MARMPGAQWRPLPGTSTAKLAAYDILCWHTMVGSLAGTDNYFRTSAAGTNSHFGVGADGTIYQWVDTAYRSGANLNGNYHIISVETADSGAPFAAWSGADVPGWNAAQIEANARIAAWVNETHSIPLDLIPDAKPGRRGNGWHRQGVPGYMVAGAEKWSSSTGKVCPGDRRIGQMPSLIARAKQIRNGTTIAPAQEDDMPATKADAELFVKTLMEWGFVTLADGRTIPYGETVKSMDRNMGSILTGNAELVGRIAGLTTALQQLAAAPSAAVDLNAVAQAAHDAAADGARSILENLRVVAQPDAASRLAS